MVSRSLLTHPSSSVSSASYADAPRLASRARPPQTRWDVVEQILPRFSITLSVAGNSFESRAGCGHLPPPIAVCEDTIGFL